MGLFSSKSSTKPVVKGPMKGYLNSFAGQVNDFSKIDPSSMIAPASNLQRQAFDGANSLGGWKTDLKQAGKYATQGAKAGPASVNFSGYDAPTAQGASLLDGLQNYMNPYTNDVVNTTLANYDEDADRAAGAMRASAAKRGAFGGSRYGVAEGEFAANTARDRAFTEASLRSNAFNTGAGLSATDAGMRQNLNMFNTELGADEARYGAEAENQEQMTNANLREQAYMRALQAAGLFTNIGNSTAANSQNDLALTADLGAMQREIEQAQRSAPYTHLAATGSLFGYVPQASYIGSKTKGSPSLFNTAMQMGEKAANAYMAGMGGA